MPDIIHQKLQDSEESYQNMTFWQFYPLFHAVQNGDMETLKKADLIHVETFPEGRITKDIALLNSINVETVKRQLG